MAILRLSLGNFKAKEDVAVSIHLEIQQNTKIFPAKINSDGGMTNNFDRSGTFAEQGHDSVGIKDFSALSNGFPSAGKQGAEGFL